MKVASVLLVLAMFILVFKMYSWVKSGRMSFTQSIFWLFVWASMGFFSIYPQYADLIMNMFSMKRREFFIIFTALFVVYFKVFNVHGDQLDNSRKIRDLYQALSIVSFQLDTLKKENDIFKKQNRST
ncbi:DUF2304 family protein [Sulfurovum sp.]|uniref:DUF2304 family protein n=1 Tax=Sulfurovum sp. TaxID=1969726 RepID=UPI00356AD5AB